MNIVDKSGFVPTVPEEWVEHYTFSSLFSSNMLKVVYPSMPSALLSSAVLLVTKRQTAFGMLKQLTQQVAQV